MIFLLYFIMQFQFLWRPYEIPAIISCIPPHVWDDRAVCSAITALVCFEAVEWHPSNRVTRQFGVYQLIPPDPINLGESHNQDLRGKTDWNWIQTHQHWINVWHSRSECVLYGHSIVDYTPSPEYWHWYQEHAANTRAQIWLSPEFHLQDPRHYGHMPPPSSISARHRHPPSNHPIGQLPGSISI